MRAGRCSPAGCSRSRGRSARRATGSSTSTIFVLAADHRRARVRRRARTSTPSRWRSGTSCWARSRCVSLWWRRRWPVAVAADRDRPGRDLRVRRGRGPGRVLQHRHPRLPPRDRRVHGRGDRGRRGLLARLSRRRAVLRPRSSLSSSLITVRPSSPGGCSRAPSATSCAAPTSARCSSRPSSARTSSRRARPSGGGSRARCTTCSRTGSRCCRVHAGALEFRPDAPPEEIAAGRRA